MAEVPDRKARALLVLPPGATSRSMVDTLTGAGIESERVDNVFQAVSAFTRNPADLIVLGLRDLTDRDLLAISVFREVREDAYVLLVFPTALRDRAVMALAQGADGYLLEPFYPGEFLDLVMRALTRAGLAGKEGLPGEDLERLAGAVAHSINNPLQILELLLSGDDPENPDPAEIRQETLRIKEVVEELLSFARRTEMLPGKVDLNEILSEELAAAAAKRPIESDLAADLPELTGDEQGLRAMVRAFAGLGAPGPLAVASETDGRGGVGMSFQAPDLILSPEERDAFFLPFAGPAGGEVGLAAATAEAVVTAHGGKVALSTDATEGTRLTVRLPARKTGSRRKK
jgi:signal transduction histidine kinase